MSKDLMTSGGSKGGMTGGAKKIITFVVGFFVLMAIVPNLQPLMDSAGSLGASVVTIVEAIVGVCQQIATAMQGVGGGQ